MSTVSLQHFESVVTSILRTTLGIIFTWLGLLKVAGHISSISSIGSVPYFGIAGSTLIFGVIEAMIGLLLLANIVWTVTEGLLLIYLLGVVTAVLAAPDLLFANAFPQLTVAGEMIIKNVAIAIAGISVLIHEQRQRIQNTGNGL